MRNGPEKIGRVAIGSKEIEANAVAAAGIGISRNRASRIAARAARAKRIAARAARPSQIAARVSAAAVAGADEVAEVEGAAVSASVVANRIEFSKIVSTENVADEVAIAVVVAGKIAIAKIGRRNGARPNAHLPTTKLRIGHQLRNRHTWPKSVRRQHPQHRHTPAAEAPPKQSAGISLWHKIFGSPVEQAAKLTEEVTSSERVEIDEGITERETSWSAVEGGRETNPVAEDEAADVEMDAGMEGGGESDESEEGEQGERRPRRRRRGRGGRSGESRGDREPSARRERHKPDRVESSGGHDDDFDDLGVEQDEDDVGSDRMYEDGDGLDDADDLDDSADGESSERAADGKGHRSIPSWDEAIGMIVDSNMQSRSQRRQSSQSGPRGNPSRGGRSRGGRRRSKPQNGQ